MLQVMCVQIGEIEMLFLEVQIQTSRSRVCSSSVLPVVDFKGSASEMGLVDDLPRTCHSSCSSTVAYGNSFYGSSGIRGHVTIRTNVTRGLTAAAFHLTTLQVGRPHCKFFYDLSPKAFFLFIS